MLMPVFAMAWKRPGEGVHNLEWPNGPTVTFADSSWSINPVVAGRLSSVSDFQQ